MSLESDTQFDKECDDLSVTSSLDISLSPCSNMSTPRIHPQYYLTDDLSVFLINEVMFRVHRHLLDRESTIFRSFPTGTYENPVCLEDVCPDEFVALLEYFYDSVHGDAPRSSEQWMHLLSISDQFEMKKVHNRAIRELESMKLDPVDRIVLAVDHNVPEWLDPAYVELCKREDPLREKEAEKVGLPTTVKLNWAREKIRTSAQLEQNSILRCQNCKSAASSQFYCSSCCCYREIPREDIFAAPLTFDETNITKVVADIFHPEKDVAVAISVIPPGHPDCLPAVPDGQPQHGKKEKKKKGGAKK